MKNEEGMNRVWEKTEPRGDCIYFLGATQSKKYGSCWDPDEGRTKLVHRYVWEQTVGPIPDDMTIDHVKERGCRFLKCVNVEHMEIVTVAENNRRKGAWIKVCKNGHKYTPENTYIYKSTGRRDCRKCRAERRKARSANQKNA